MKKTIVAAAIAAVVSAPAMADLTVYGKAHLAATSSDSTTDNDAIDSRASRIGFKSTEDLGNGMKAFAQFEYETQVMDGKGDFAARDSFVGVSGDFGKIAAGRMASPMKGVLYGVGNVQLADANQGNDFAQAFASKASVSTITGDKLGRTSNAIAYSNSFNGVDLTIACVGDDTAPGSVSANSTSGTGFCEHTSASIATSVAGAKLAAGTIDMEGGASANIFGVKYSAGDLTASVVYEDVDGTGAIADNDVTGLSLSYTMGNNVLSASMSTKDFAGATKDTDRMNLGFEHKMSKKTSVYVSYAEVDTGTASTTVDYTSVGITHSF